MEHQGAESNAPIPEETSRQERRAQRQQRARQRIRKHGSSLKRVYRNAITKRTPKKDSGDPNSHAKEE